MEILENNMIQVCLCQQAVDTDRGNQPVGAPIMLRYVLRPGASLAGQPAKVVKVCQAVWSP